ncbi:MAG: ABC transporter permease [Anaerolineae bacterium]|jgi:ABC-2 type transport system permease protein
MLARIWNLVWKEVIQFGRDRMLTAFLFMLPMLQLVLLAQATGRRIGNLDVAVLDMDRSATTRRLITNLDNQEELVVRYFVESEDQLRSVLDRGLADAAVIFPGGLSRDLAHPARTAQIRVVVDGSNSMVGSIALGAARNVVSEYSQGGRDLSAGGPIDLRVVVRYNPSFNLRYFAIPAQVGFITYQITLAVASLGLARERELGTLEQLIVAPFSRLEVVLGKAIPALMIGASNFLLMVGVAIHLLDIPLRGSFLLLFGITLLFVVAEIGWGVIISTVSRTQQQAILFVFILAMVDMSFSGYLVPVENLPGLLRLIARVVPMYHYLLVIRGIMLKGAVLATIWPHALALAGLGLAILAVAVAGVSQGLD